MTTQRGKSIDQSTLAALIARTAEPLRTPTLITVSDEAGHLSVNTDHLDQISLRDDGLDVLLVELSHVMGIYRFMFTDVCAYALALPDSRIAYVADIDGRFTSIETGPNPRDNAATRAGALRGLTAMVQAGPGLRSSTSRAGQAFPGLDLTTRTVALPPSAPPAPPAHTPRNQR